VGLALIGMERHDEARAVLEPLAEADVGYERRTLQEQCAHALIRSSESGNTDELLGRAEKRLRRILKVHGDAGETYGLLGSAYKRQVETALAGGQPADAASLELAIDAYRRGFQSEPGDYYPGVNALALLRLRGQRLGGSATDVEEARALLPVVRFAILRLGDVATEDVWAQLTLAECALHAYFLDGAPEELSDADRRYALAAPQLSAQHRGSAARQLKLMSDAGDPADTMGQLLDHFSGDAARKRGGDG
jgi:hypothetical protein